MDILISILIMLLIVGIWMILVSAITTKILFRKLDREVIAYVKWNAIEAHIANLKAGESFIPMHGIDKATGENVNIVISVELAKK